MLTQNSSIVYSYVLSKYYYTFFTLVHAMYVSVSSLCNAGVHTFEQTNKAFSPSKQEKFGVWTYSIEIVVRIGHRQAHMDNK